MKDDEDVVNALRVVDFLASLPVGLFASVMFTGFLFVPPGGTAYPRSLYLMVSVLTGYVSMRLMVFSIGSAD